jgi:DamX protein
MTLLIIDDAQYLPQAFLEECLVEIKKYDNGNFFHICLVSDFTLVSTLNKLNTNVFKNLIHTIVLGSLTEDETKTYVMKTLSVGNCLDNSVTAQRLHAFYHFTEGNIGVINREMAHFFDKKTTRQHTIIKKSFKPVALIASVVIAGLGATYTWQHQIEFFPKYNGLTQKDAIAKISDSLKTSEQIIEHPLVSSLPQLTHNAIKESLPVQKLVSETALAPLISQVVSQTANNDLVLSSDVQQIDATQLDKLVAINEVTNDRNIDRVAPKVMPNWQELIALDKDGSLALTATIKQQKLPTVLSKTNTTAILKSSSQATTINRKVAKYNSKPIPSVDTRRQFTIQLMASRNKNSLTNFVDNHHIGKIAKIYKIKNNGISWYVLTMGNYKKRHDANHAMQQLPIPLANLKPWIRAIKIPS